VPDELENVRYIVEDVEDAVAFYSTHFGLRIHLIVEDLAVRSNGCVPPG
jgi:catechol 2,3-dioxygenase-like lactoylglutathione lyase family enzyme